MPTDPQLPITVAPSTPAWFTTWLTRNNDGKKLTSGHTLGTEKCGNCKQLILTGDDAPTAAFRVRADPTPLTALTEVACLIAGRKTFLIDVRAGRIALHARDRWQIRGLPPGKNVVVPAHKCGARFPEPHLPKESTSNDCPF